MSFRSGACQPGTQMGDIMVTEPDGSATLKMPDRASRIECTRSCVAAVLPVEEKIVGAELSERGEYQAYGTLLAFLS